jgi:mono/diheme cytochrome c family protein
MKKLFRTLGIVLASIIGVLVITVVIIFFLGSKKIAASPAVAHDFTAPAPDSVMVAKGEQLASAVSRCTGCHGQGLKGSIVGEESAFGLFVASNLTSGKGGVGGSFSDADWEKAIRHGIEGDGRVLIGMPAEFFSQYSKEDFSALLSYVKQLPPVDNELPKTKPGLIAKIFIGAGLYTPPSLVVDPAMAHAESAPTDSPIEFGKYLTNLAACGECHGAALKGPEYEGPPPGPDLSKTGNLSSWSEADFFRALRTGSTPDGRILDPNMMPWPRFTRMSDAQVSATWAYLGSIN